MFLCLTLTGLCGCASTRQSTKIHSTPPLSKQIPSAERNGFSDDTERVLRYLGLEKEIKRDSSGVIDKLVEKEHRQPSPKLTFTIAELSFHEARRQEHGNGEAAQEYYLRALTYAFRFLFPSDSSGRHYVGDPNFLHASQIYNGSLESILRLQGNGSDIDLGTESCFSIKQPDGRVYRIRCHSVNGDVAPADMEPLQFASDYSVKGLKQEFRQNGLGVPLLGKRKLFSKPTLETKYTPASLTFPMTAVLRPLPCGTRWNDGTPVDAVVEFYDPLKTPVILLAGQSVQLEADFSTPIACTLSDPRMTQLHTFGLVRSDLISKPVEELLEETPRLKRKISDEEVAWIESQDDELKRKTLQGLYLMQPYENGKIPVVFIHGLWSSPMTWMEMFNALRVDPALRDRYQFVFYFYPTGQPFWISAADLRRDLSEFRRTFDPHGNNGAFDQMVLIGHSMGGLIAHLQTMDSGMDFWKLVSDESPEKVLEEIKDPTTDLREWFLFKADPSVRCVVSIATPFQGSRASNHFTQQVTGKMIKLPKKVTEAATGWVTGETRAVKSDSLLRMKTSIESLSPDNPIFGVMQMKYGESSVCYYNIPAVMEPRTPLQKLKPPSDGVVALASARLSDCERETVVQSNHVKVHTDSETIREIRAILQEHLSGVREMLHDDSEGRN